MTRQRGFRPPLETRGSFPQLNAAGSSPGNAYFKARTVIAPNTPPPKMQEIALTIRSPDAAAPVGQVI